MAALYKKKGLGIITTKYSTWTMDTLYTYEKSVCSR